MKNVVALSFFALLGASAGYLFAPVLSIGMVRSSDAEMFATYVLGNYKSSVVCDCNGRPATENLKELSQYLSTLQRSRETKQNSKVLAQEIGLTYVRLSMVEEKLGQQPQADQDVSRGQTELAALGWKDLAKPHLTSLVIQLNSEYKPADGDKLSPPIQ
jgi:hypothetical protein